MNDTLEKTESWIQLVMKHGFTNVFAIASMCLLMYFAYTSFGVVAENAKAIKGLSEATKSSTEAIESMQVEIKLLLDERSTVQID